MNTMYAAVRQETNPNIRDTHYAIKEIEGIATRQRRSDHIALNIKRKIKGINNANTSKKEECTCFQHNPPFRAVYREGVHEHICPGCGNRQEFTAISSPYYSTIRYIYNAD